MVGGGMRQAGVIAAAGMYALDHHIDRLAEDHDKATKVASAVNERFQSGAVANTNMVFVDLPDTKLVQLIDHFANRHIRISRARWVFHLDISFEDTERIVDAVQEF
jgi:threonine aldolase